MGRPDIAHEPSTPSCCIHAPLSATTTVRHSETVAAEGGAKEITKPTTQRLATSVASVR